MPTATIDPRIAATRNARVRVARIPAPHDAFNGKEGTVTRRLRGATRFAVTFDDKTRADVAGENLDFVGEGAPPAKADPLERFGTLPEIARSDAQVTFKHEGDIRGRAYGRASLTDIPAFRAWCDANGHRVSTTLGTVTAFVPMGSEPVGQHRFDVFRSEAAALAKRYGVKLQEF